MDDVYDTIRVVTDGLGYDCRRADDVQHVDEISAKVRDLIRESAFVVADLSGSRPNVYYEVGYAHALGKPVVLTVRQGETVNFDLRQFNTVHYSTMRELRTQLKIRIEGTVGQARRVTQTTVAEAEPPSAELDDSLQLMNSRIAANPDDAEAYSARAMLLRALGRYDAAYQDLRRALELQPGEPRNLTNLAHFLNGARRFEESLEVIDRALALDPVNSKALALKAYALNGMRRYEEAAVAAREVLTREPEHLVARRLLEVAQRFLRDLEPAEASAEPEALSPVEELLTLGFSLNNAGEYERALEAYEKALSLGPTSVAARIGRGYTLNRLRRHAEALAEYDQVVRLDPGNANAHIQRGFTLNALSRFAEASAAAREGLRLDPGNRAGLRVLDTALRHSRSRS